MDIDLAIAIIIGMVVLGLLIRLVRQFMKDNKEENDLIHIEYNVESDYYTCIYELEEEE